MKIRIIIILCFLAFFNSFAQKSAPVAGHAAELIDLLKKDYAAVDPNKKEEILHRDRIKTIAIFKTYLFKVGVDTKKDIKKYKDLIKEKQESIKKQKKKLQYLRQIHPRLIDATAYNENVMKIDNLEDSIQIKMDSLVKYRYQLHNSELAYLKLAYSDNPYLKNILDKFIKKYKNLHDNELDIYAKINYESSIQKAIPFLGGDLAFETIIDGLSKFLVKRIKAELTNYVMENIKDKLENPSQTSLLNELLVLLPKTTDFIKQFDAEELLNFTNEFKEYIETDLNNLLANAVHLKTTPRLKKLIEGNPDFAFAFEALEIMPLLSKVENPIDYFDMLENSETISSWSSSTNTSKRNIANSIMLSSMLAHSLMVLNKGQLRFASTNFMANYGSESEFFLLYIGFLSQQNSKYYTIKFEKELNFNAFMNKVKAEDVIKKTAAVKSTVKAIQRSLTSISSNAEKLYQEALAIKKRSKDDEKEIDILMVHSFVGSFISFFEELIVSTDIILKEGKKHDLEVPDFTLKEKMTPYFSTAKSANSIVLDLHQKKFSSAIITSMEIPMHFTNKEISSGKLLHYADNIENIAQLNLFKELFSTYKKLPSKEVKLESLKELVGLINVSLEPKITSFNSIKSKITSLEEKLIDKTIKKEDYVKILDSIRLEIIEDENLKAILKHFVNIDVEKVTNNIIDLVNGNDTYKEKIKKSLDTYINSAIKKTLFSKDSLNDEFDNAKVDLQRTMRIYFPELVENVFAIKDKNAIKIIHFVSDIANSENAEDVEQALDAFALPTGSYTIKRKAKFNVSLNAYPGIVIGSQFNKYKNQKNEVKYKGASSFGLTAPIGISFTFKSGKINPNLFISVIDIAAPVRFRLDNNNETKTLPEFNFKNIFSPGIYIGLPLGKSPFALQLGAQYGPELSFTTDIDQNAISNFNKETFSVNLGIVLDIPLFTIYNKPSE